MAPSIVNLPIYEIDGKLHEGDIMLTNPNGVWMMPMIDELPIYHTLGLNWVGFYIDDSDLNLPTVGPGPQVLVAQREDCLRSFDADQSERWSYAYPTNSECDQPISVGADGTIYVSLRGGSYGGPGYPGPGYPGSGSGAGISALALQADGSFDWQLGYPLEFPRQFVIAPDETAYAIARSATGDGVALFAIGGTGNNRPPDASPDLGAYAGSIDSIEVYWGAAPGATGYELFRDSQDEPYRQFGAEILYYRDNGMESGEIHTYWIRAINSFGASVFSRPATGSSRVQTPADFAASNGEFADRILLTWTRLPNATGYKIHRDYSQHLSEPYAIVGNVSEWADFSITDWEQHTYKIIAFNEIAGGYFEEDTGYVQRGTGDSGPGTWRQSGKDAGHSYRAESIGPDTMPEYSAVLLDPYKYMSLYGTRDTLFGSENCQYLLTQSIGVLALHPDGTLRWRYPDGTRAVVLDDGSIVLASFDGLTRLSSDGTVLSINDSVRCNQVTLAHSGDLIVNEHGAVSRYTAELSQVWTYELLPQDFAGSSEPMAVDAADNVYFWTAVEHKVITLDADGKKQWEFSAAAQVIGLNIGIDGSILVRTDEEHLHSLSSAGAENWSAPLRGSLGIRNDGMIVLVEPAGRVLLLDPVDGTAVWEYDPPTGTMLIGPPVIDAAGTSFHHFEYHDPEGSGELLAGVLALDPAGGFLWRIDLPDFEPSGLALDDTGTLWLTTGTELEQLETRTRRWWFK
ncbi:MAG TPA: hypothetical protein ENO21_02735 [Firmicutes bacterium]|nr:hypothetical protein [Bacillota bacterium]